MKLLLENWKKYLHETNKSWDQQEFGDARGTWIIGDLHKYIQEKGIQKQPFSVDELAKNNLDPEEGAQTSDASPEDFKGRAHASDLQFPIVVVKYPDGLWIADGVHRTWKAREAAREAGDKTKTIMGYLLHWKKDLLKIPHSEASEESKNSPY